MQRLSLARAGVVLFSGLALLLSSSCSSSECDASKCASGNICIAAEDGTKCRRPCTNNYDPTQSCPFNYTCRPNPEGLLYCAKNKVELRESAAGLWGAPCNPLGGREANPDCDIDQGFQCFGKSPTDAAAYCTRYNCETDDDCGPGFGCQAVNTTPDVTSPKRLAIGDVVNVCVRRVYCSACRWDSDCLPLEGRTQRCLSDDNGATFCAPDCTNDTSCAHDAYCADFGDFKACYPRAGVCVGDGTLCSPCRSDADCPDGACVDGVYTTERHCATRAPQDCKGGTERGGCPNRAPNPPVLVGCRGDDETVTEVPPNYCHGAFSISGVPAGIGCWSPDRK